jgi:transcriptional antiterminator RfaH
VFPPSGIGATDDRWYLARLKPGGFARATVNLERQGVGTFMPLQDVTERRAGRLVTRRKPLFPGYLFVRLDAAAEAWRRVNATYGVASLIALRRDEPTPVPAAVMDALFAHTSPEGLYDAPHRLAVGDAVRVIAGPLAQSFARIEAVPDDVRVHVLLEMMGQAVRATVGRAALQSA